MTADFVLMGIIIILYALVLALFKNGIKNWGENGKNMILVLPPLFVSQSLKDILMILIEKESFWLHGIFRLIIGLLLVLVNAKIIKLVVKGFKL